MTLTDFLLLLLIAGVIGAVGQAIAGYSHGGCLVSIGVGFIGALVGTWLARKFNLPDFFVLKIGATSFPVVWSIAGAAIFTALIGLMTRFRD